MAEYIISSGESSNGIILNSYETMTVLEGGIASETVVNQYGDMSISSGGTAKNTMVNSSGRMYVSQSGMANSTTVNILGSMYVSSGGTASNTIVNFGGRMAVSSGGTADSTTVNSAGQLFIFYGTANEIIENGGYVEVKDATNAKFASNTFTGLVLSSTTATVHSGTTANSITVSSRGGLVVFSGGVANSTTVDFGGELFVSSGGTATITFNLWQQGSIVSCNGAVVTYLDPDADIYYGNRYQGLISKTNTIESLNVESGLSAIVFSGGTANNIIASSGACIFFDVASNTYVKGTYDGNNFEMKDASISGYTIHSGCSITVFSDGTANSTTVNSDGRVYVSSGGMTNNTTINSGGSMFVYNGGTANSSTIVYNGGRLNVNPGGKLTGRMVFNSGAIVIADACSILDFDLTQTSADKEALVNDLSVVQGAPFYTITVDGMESAGTYRLADGVSFFTGVIAVMNTSETQLGTLMVGQKLETEYADYTLKVANGSLTVTVSTSGVVPPAGDTVAPTDPSDLMPIVDGQNVALLWNESTDEGSGIKEYIVKYSLGGEIFTARTTIPHYILTNADFGSYSWSVQAVDFAGNESAITVGDVFTVSNFKTYVVEYSTDNFEHVLGLAVNSDALDSFRLPTGTYQSRTRSTNSADWTTVEQPLISLVDNSPTLIQSDADGNADVFFANPAGTWESGYVAQHVGSINDWGGTNEYASVYGKNKLADIIEGSSDANILLMTDDDNGDTLFVDDIYTASPGNMAEQQARIARIDEIRAGAGNDIVDMTSQQFEYIGNGLTIRGGAGNDTIWANKGDNRLFGDAGNDRIVGASGNDVIVGGIGNDRMHGGGGNDVFTFCDNWGVDNVEQLETGTVTLWFTEGSKDNWNEATMTYTDGENSVKVSGVAADKITLKFADDGSEDFATLSGMGSFFDATTERIFEESGKGILASL